MVVHSFVLKDSNRRSQLYVEDFCDSKEEDFFNDMYEVKELTINIWLETLVQIMWDSYVPFLAQNNHVENQINTS